MRPRGCKQIVICCGEMEGRKVWEGKRVSGEERAGGPEDRAMEGGEGRNLLKGKAVGDGEESFHL